MRRHVIAWLLPGSMAGRMIGVLALAFAALLGVLTLAEQSRPGGIYTAASDEESAVRIRRMAGVLARIRPAELESYADAASLCHLGYEVSNAPFGGTRTTSRTEAVAHRLAERLDILPEQLRVGLATLTPDRFGYAKCRSGEIAFPIEGLVISLRFAQGQWLHAEVHPHEPHFQTTFADWFQRSAFSFLLVAGIAALFLHRLAKPLRALSESAMRFGAGLQAEPIAEIGPPDVRQMIAAFNTMQRQVTEVVAQRSMTLAALSHDLRTPLTALRVKAELVEDERLQEELIASIRKMEAIAKSAIEFLQGESRAEPMRTTDLVALVESECADFEDIGAPVCFSGKNHLHCQCRPDALSRAVRNLIDNAVKYGCSAAVSVRDNGNWAEISVADTGPGISSAALASVVEPFVRLSHARESNVGGSGLGLAVAKAVAEGHSGELILGPNAPHGLIAVIKLPLTADRSNP